MSLDIEQHAINMYNVYRHYQEVKVLFLKTNHFTVLKYF